MREGARWACKPGSVVGGHLSRTTVSGRLERATRARCGPHHGAPICVCSGRGLPSRRVATTLVVSYTTVSAFPSTGRARQRESSFLRRFPSGYPARPLAGFLPCGARTFLMAQKRPAVAWPTSRRRFYHEARRAPARLLGLQYEQRKREAAPDGPVAGKVGTWVCPTSWSSRSRDGPSRRSSLCPPPRTPRPCSPR